MVSDAEFGSYGSEKELNAALKKQGKTTFKGDGAWNAEHDGLPGQPARAATRSTSSTTTWRSSRPSRSTSPRSGSSPTRRSCSSTARRSRKDMGFVKGHKYEVPGHAARRRQGKGLRQNDDHAEVRRLDWRPGVAARCAAFPRGASRTSGGAAAPGRTRLPRSRRPAAERPPTWCARMTRRREDRAADDRRRRPSRAWAFAAYDWWNEALHGVARAGRRDGVPAGDRAWRRRSTCRWSERVATAISDEARAKYNLAQGARASRGRYHGLTFFSPNVNIFRDPRWGRGQETYGEDPTPDGARWAWRSSGACRGTIRAGSRPSRPPSTSRCTAGPRPTATRSTPAPSAHDLADTYLPQFEAAVRRGARRVRDGRLQPRRRAAVPPPAPWLLGRRPAARRGVSTATSSATAARWTTSSPATTRRRTREAAAADGAAGRHRPRLRAAPTRRCAAGAGAAGWSPRRISIARWCGCCTARVRLGLFDPPDAVPWAGLGSETVDSPAHRQPGARGGGAKSIVLLENRNGALPLGPVGQAVGDGRADGRRSAGAAGRLRTARRRTPVTLLDGHPRRGAGARRSPCATRAARRWPARAARSAQVARGRRRRPPQRRRRRRAGPGSAARRRKRATASLNPAGDRRDARAARRRRRSCWRRWWRPASR